MSKLSLLSLIPILSASLSACGDDPVGVIDQELITRVELVFTPTGGAPITAAYDDPDGDGGAPPTVDPLALAPSATYAMAVRFLNALETPAEDITVEVRDERDQHQVFFTGDAVDGPASRRPGAPLLQSYADTDANGAPVGLDNVVTTSPGAGTLVVTLRHLPPVNGEPVKTADLAGLVLTTERISALPGETDAQVTFQVTVPTAP